MTILPPFRSESLPIIKEIMDLLLNETAVLSDAIVWLQGNRFDRGEKVLALWTEERASLVVLSGNNVLLGDTRPGEDNVSVVQMKDWLNERGVPTDQICVDEQAMNTKDQAKNVLALAVARGWRRIILVASMEHQLRAFLTFLKATQAQGWSGRIINQPVIYPDWGFIPDGRIISAGEIFQDELVKIKYYSEHVATMAAGLEYLIGQSNCDKV